MKEEQGKVKFRDLRAYIPDILCADVCQGTDLAGQESNAREDEHSRSS